MSFGNNPEKMKNITPDISFDEFREVVREQNKPKYGWRKKGKISQSEFDQLKDIRDREEYRKEWKSIKKERREDDRKERERRTNPRV